MCMFSQPVQHVSTTCIFARGCGAEQILAYSMDFRAARDLAMILPLPVPPSPAEDAVRFIDLSGYPDLFKDMRKAFPPRWLSLGIPSASPVDHAVLQVHDVGAFEASFVPTLADFERLDDRFRLPDTLWSHLPHYADWGFAVFKLRKSNDQQHLHPMALAFPRRDRSRLFFPTVHVHDGSVHKTAKFDHELFCQTPTELEPPMPPPVESEPLVDPLNDWQTSEGSLATFVDFTRANAILDVASPGHRRELRGMLPNEDIWVEAADAVTAT